MLLRARGCPWVPYTPLHEAAQDGRVDAVRRLLSEDGSKAARATAGFLAVTPLHLAAGTGHAAVVQALLEAAPDVALVADLIDRLPLHHAAWSEQPSSEVVRLLLEAAPGTASTPDTQGDTPLHLAMHSGGTTGVMQLLMADAPASPGATNVSGELPLHQAAHRCHAEAVGLLLDAWPESARARNANGQTPLWFAAAGAGTMHGRLKTVQQLLAAAPGMAVVVDHLGSTPLHMAARYSCPEVVGLLLAAAPEAALMPDVADSLPLHLALRRGDCSRGLEAARCLPTAGSAQQLLPVLLGAGEHAHALFATLVSRLPLNAEQWQHVPAGCPGLGAVLPAVLARSEREAECLVQRLPVADHQRLRTFALSLSRAQRQLGARLPLPVVQRILSMFGMLL